MIICRIRNKHPVCTPETVHHGMGPHVARWPRVPFAVGSVATGLQKEPDDYVKTPSTAYNDGNWTNQGSPS
jgi:hypothetical protein